MNEAFAAKLAEKAEAIRVDQGWAWVETHDEQYLGWNFMEDRKFARVSPVEGVLSDDLSERYEELSEMAEGDVLNEAGQEELDGLQSTLDGDFTAEQKAAARRFFKRAIKANGVRHRIVIDKSGANLEGPSADKCWVEILSVPPPD